MTKMTAQEKQTFLADLHVGVLGINDGTHGPLTVPVWYDYTPGADVWFITGATSRKAKLLKVGDRISMVAQTEKAPYVYVSVEGVVNSIEPAKEASLLAMAVRYLGPDQGKAYADNSPIEGQVQIDFTPQRWLAVDYAKM